MAAWKGVLEALVTQRRSALVGYAYVLCADRPMAEDLVQEAIVRTFSRAGRLTDVRHAEGYVKRAIRTQFLNSRRHAAVERAKRHLIATDDARPPDASLDEHDELRRALRELTPRERACVLLRYYDDLAVADVAAELGLGVGTVKRYLHNATQRLRGLLAVDGEERETSPVDVRGRRS